MKLAIPHLLPLDCPCGLSYNNLLATHNASWILSQSFQIEIMRKCYKLAERDLAQAVTLACCPLTLFSVEHAVHLGALSGYGVNCKE